jgi:pimeloyl-ACP methyl ester carboxylesterase
METCCIDLEIAPIGKIPIFLKKWGRGPKVLLVHGWLSSSRRWHHFGEHFARHYEVWALDLPASGETPALPQHHTTLETYAEILARLINHLTDGKRLHSLVGHSMGGLLSLLSIQNHPSFCTCVIVCGAPVVGVRYLKPLTDLEDFVAKCLLTAQSLPIVRKCIGDANVHAAAVLLKQLCACNVLNQLKPSPANVLVARGEHDPYLSPTAAEQLAEKLGGLFYEFQGAYHSPMTEQPDDFHRVAGGFLDKA